MEARAFEGFVLAGGRSSRMGRDKALLPFEDQTLVEHVAAEVRSAAGCVTLIGPARRYESLGLPLAADLLDGCGPMGGVLTALTLTSAAWNLIVACDMPGVTGAFLSGLLEAAQASSADCLVPHTTSGLHPLCAVYHVRALPAIHRAIEYKSFAMHHLLDSLQTVSWPVADASLLRNVNTPVEWAAP
jgi:molybdopterin-guanine dinucleotide biosynthesis protein A